MSLRTEIVCSLLLLMAPALADQQPQQTSEPSGTGSTSGASEKKTESAAGKTADKAKELGHKAYEATREAANKTADAAQKATKKAMGAIGADKSKPPEPASDKKQ